MKDEEKIQQHQKDEQALKERLSVIKHKILVMSGKGGVGKSTVAVNLAVALAKKDKQVGLLDVDIHGPNVPYMLGVEGQRVTGTEKELQPFDYSANLKLMSISFLLQDRDAAVIWRGPLKMNIIRQFLKDVRWGALDYLIVDAPPGTGDEPLSVCQLIPDADGAVIVTTGQEVSLLDVRKSITFCKQVKMPVLGVVENMGMFRCPHCGKEIDIFKSGGGEKMADSMGVRFLGTVPLDPSIVVSGDKGVPIIIEKPDSESAKAFLNIADALVK